MDRRTFLEMLSGIAAASGVAVAQGEAGGSQPRRPERIENEYSLFLPGEREILAADIRIRSLGVGKIHAAVGKSEKDLSAGEQIDGWILRVLTTMNGTETAVFERSVTHQGAMVYVTEREGVILRIRKGVGELSSIRPRRLNAGGVRLSREVPYRPGPDLAGNAVLQSREDPCYENMAGLGAEYVGYTLVGNEEAGPLGSLFLDADGTSRQYPNPNGQGSWAPDLSGAVFDPSQFFPANEPNVYDYVPGYSKRTLLHGYLPVANTGVWNPETKGGYEVIVLLPPGTDAKPIARVRTRVPSSVSDGEMEAEGRRLTLSNGFVDHYWNTSPAEFYRELAGVANHWQHFFEDQMQVVIPDEWLLNAAKAGIVLSRCSYRGLEPSYQVGEGAYTKIPERSHALFPVSFYEFVWAHQLWNLTSHADAYVQHYLHHYVLPDGNFVYNTQDQAEAPLCIGVFLWNAARGYAYTRDGAALLQQLPVLRRMTNYLLERYAYSKRTFAEDDRRHGLIWGSPEADLGDPNNDYPNSHPFYFQNAIWAWRGIHEFGKCLHQLAQKNADAGLAVESRQLQQTATEMRGLVERSLQRTLEAASPAMKQAGITPFSPDDVAHDPKALSSYENHRFMMDWFLADWGEEKLDQGHLKHRELAGEQIFGLGTDGAVSRISNFMEHGTLAVRIRQEDYRRFLLSLYGLCCFAADSGNRYSPEDAYLPGGRPHEGNPYQWSAVVNSVLQPTMGLRWLLCYEESDRDVCHVQKAAPKHWFAVGPGISVSNCPTRWGIISWRTRVLQEGRWRVEYQVAAGFSAELRIHIHPLNDVPLARTGFGVLTGSVIILSPEILGAKLTGSFEVYT